MASSTLKTVAGFAERNAQIFAGLGLSVILGIKIYPNTLGLGSWEALMANYTADRKPETVSKKTLELADQVMFDILLQPHFETKVSFFAAYGHDMIHKGSCKMVTGGRIGVPSIFNFNSLTEVARQPFELNRQPVDWSSSGGQLLMPSLLLSEKAQKFALAREIYYVETNTIYTDSFLTILFGGGSYTAGFALSRMYNFKRNLKTWARGGVYGLIGMTGLALYITIMDTYTCRRDRKCDRKAGLLGLDYAEGGVEYYEKKLLRNKALFTLLGNAGSTYYTPYGNEKATYRRPHAQLSERRENMVKLVKEINNKPEIAERPERATIQYKRENKMDTMFAQNRNNVLNNSSSFSDWEKDVKEKLAKQEKIAKKRKEEQLPEEEKLSTDDS